MTVPESDRDKVIRDPVHNLIRLPRADKRLLLKILDSPEMQRLRRIRQLGLGCLTYPGAEHSRFAHSLGVYHVARRMIDALERHYDSGAPELKAVKEVRREVLVAALLHDVGHGPFSHLFESALPEVKGAPTGYPDNHEGWSRRIIKERFAEHLGQEVKTDVIVDLLRKKSRQNLLAKDFISSQLDADRLDFLARDRHAAGVRYGAFDLEWILNVIRVGTWNPPGSGKEQLRLCFLEGKAAPVITEFLLARAYLYRELYVHKTTRGYEALFRNILKYAATLAERNTLPPETPAPFREVLSGRPLTTDGYLALDDFVVWTLLSSWFSCSQDDTLKDMCGRLLNRSRPYQHVRLNEKSTFDVASLLTDLDHKDSPLRFSCYLDRFEDLAYDDLFGASAKEDEERQYRSILLLDDTGSVRHADSDEWIGKVAEFKVEAYRLYYDDQNAEMTSRLRHEGLLS
jgi:HD superfamily phosphohydrolase